MTTSPFVFAGEFRGAKGNVGPTGEQGIQGPPGPGTGAGAWQPNTAYTANQVVQAPDGSIIYRISSGISRASFDPTEKALWAAVSTKSGTIENDSLTASFGRIEFDLDGTPVIVVGTP